MLFIDWFLIPINIWLSVLKKQGLGVSFLNVVFNALVVFCIEHSLPSLSGFCVLLTSTD